MVWQDFLKGILPDAFFKGVYINKSDNRQIIFTGNTIISGDQIVNDPAIIKETLDTIGKQYATQESLPFELLHKELVDDFIQYESIMSDSKVPLQILRPVLSSDDMECVLMVRRTVRTGKDEYDELVEQLQRKYPKRGKKILNLMGAGYFDEVIIPFATIHKTPAKFQEFYNGVLDFFPSAIFVGNKTTDEIVLIQLKRRLEMLKAKTLPFIRLHAVGKINMQKVEKTLKEVPKEFDIERREYLTAQDMVALTVEINLSNKN